MGTRDIATITRRDISGVVQKIIDRGSPVAANRTLADLNHLFQFAWERGYVEVNPCSGFSRKSAGGREKPRDRALDWDEIESLFGTEYDSPVTRVALYICLLTGQRASEVLWIMTQPPARWVELPDTKSGRPHKVYLSVQVRAALKLLNGLPPPRSHRVLSHALRRVGASFTPHDLRRTMATRLADLGIAPHVTEKMLNHQMEGVMAVYNHAEYLPERKAAWRLWGAEIAKKRRASRS
jgi:integrase